jgi:hypothetical protein
MRFRSLSTTPLSASTRGASRLLLGLTTAALVAGSFVALPVIARAAGVSLVEDFSGNALPDTLEESGGTADYSGGSAAFPGGPVYSPGDARRYLRTITNYDTTPFVAEATVTISNTYGPDGIAFFGLGVGDVSGFYGEPRNTPTTYVRIVPDTFGGTFSITTSAAENIGGTTTAGAGTHRVRLTWNPLTSTFVAEIHQDYAGGPFVPTATIVEVVAEPFGDTNTRIFFGGSGDVVFDDFQVTALEAVAPGAKDCVGKTNSALANTYGGIAQAAEAFGFPSVKALQAYIKTACAG